MANSRQIPMCRALIADLLPRCYPKVEQTAGLLGVPVRTLQRRLKDHGQSYSELVEAIRSERACRLLEEPQMRVADVAKALGYTDPSSFSRAFRRWTGISPRAYRRRC